MRPSDAELGKLAAAIDTGRKIAIYGGSGCEFAQRQVLALAEKLKAPVARTSRAKDFLEHDNPFDVGMTGIFGTEGGYHALEHPRQDLSARACGHAAGRERGTLDSAQCRACGSRCSAVGQCRRHGPARHEGEGAPASRSTGAPRSST